MILITSMGGCGSTGLIAWAAKHIDCNCPLNSEGLPAPGPGANHKGLKHRSSPPMARDPYLGGERRIERSVFLFDSPYQIIPSLFRRKIASGHAVAITGRRPRHENDLAQFLDEGIDSFGFGQQFERWTDSDSIVEYPRMLVRSSSVWANLFPILEFLGLPAGLSEAFPPFRKRRSSFEGLPVEQQEKIRGIYGNLDRKMNSLPEVSIIP